MRQKKNEGKKDSGKQTKGGEEGLENGDEEREMKKKTRERFKRGEPCKKIVG